MELWTRHLVVCLCGYRVNWQKRWEVCPEDWVIDSNGIQDWRMFSWNLSKRWSGFQSCGFGLLDMSWIYKKRGRSVSWYHGRSCISVSKSWVIYWWRNQLVWRRSSVGYSILRTRLNIWVTGLITKSLAAGFFLAAWRVWARLWPPRLLFYVKLLSHVGHWKDSCDREVGGSILKQNGYV